MIQNHAIYGANIARSFIPTLESRHFLCLDAYFFYKKPLYIDENLYLCARKDIISLNFRH